MVNVETNAISWNKRKAAFMGRLVWSSPIHTMVRNDQKCLMIINMILKMEMPLIVLPSLYLHRYYLWVP